MDKFILAFAVTNAFFWVIGYIILQKEKKK